MVSELSHLAHLAMVTPINLTYKCFLRKNSIDFEFANKKMILLNEKI